MSSRSRKEALPLRRLNMTRNKAGRQEKAGQKMAKFCALYSGSSGNCTYIASGGTAVLVDAGVSCKRILTAMQECQLDREEVQGILLTHEHIDHIRGLKVLLKHLKVPVYASEGTLHYLIANGLVPADARLVEITAPTRIGGMEVTPFATPHDGAETLGFVVHTGDGRKIGVATDLGHVPPQVDAALSTCDLVLLESNYDEGMLACGPYPYYLKRRIKSPNGHLSNEDCCAQVQRLIEGGTTRFVLGHLSQQNNLPMLARQTVLSALEAAGCREGVDYILQVARRSQPSEIILL